MFNNYLEYTLVIAPESDYFEYKKHTSDKNNPYYNDKQYILVFSDKSHIKAIKGNNGGLMISPIPNFGIAKRWANLTAGIPMLRNIDNIKMSAKNITIIKHNGENVIKLLFKNDIITWYDNILPTIQNIIDIHMERVDMLHLDKNDIKREKEFETFKVDLLEEYIDKIIDIILNNNDINIIYDCIKSKYILQLA